MEKMLKNLKAAKRNVMFDLFFEVDIKIDGHAKTQQHDSFKSILESEWQSYIAILPLEMLHQNPHPLLKVP